MNEPRPLDYETPTRKPGSGWAICSLAIGLGGAPATLAMARLFEGRTPLVIGAAAALVFMCTTETRWRGHALGNVGAIVTLLWAPALLGLSLFAGVIL